MSNVVQASYRVGVDVKKVNTLLSQLNDKDSKKAIKAGLRKSASVIRKEAQKNWVASVPNGAKMKKEINLAVYRNASGARVDLLDKRRKDSKQFTLKFFDSGTKERKVLGKKSIKAGANRGVINATNFFANAVNSKKTEAESSLEQNLIASIRKVIDKNK